MTLSQIMIVSFFMLLMMTCGWVMGVNSGILMSSKNSAVEACENFRFSIYVCNSLKFGE